MFSYVTSTNLSLLELPFLRREMGKKAMTGKWLCELRSPPRVGHPHQLWALEENGGSLPVTTPTDPGPQLLPPHLD